MTVSRPIVLIRLLPVLLVNAAAMACVYAVEGPGAYAPRNTLPMLAVVALSIAALWRGRGRWLGAGWGWPLGIIGFAIPALGLSMYLHYGYAVDRDGMFSESIYPQEVFRYLPAYTMVTGGIGFAIGWIAGRKI
ncbi:MAG: hypothetical protein ACREQZ_13010 [Woeseiaceae bacterium]